MLQGESSCGRPSGLHEFIGTGTAILSLLCILASASYAVAEVALEREAAFVFPMTSGNAAAEELTFFDELLTQTLAEHAPHPILSTSDIQALVKHREQEQLLGCVDDACGQELAELTGSRYLIRGRVHTVGESFHILLTLLDTKGENQPARSRKHTGLKKPKSKYALLRVRPVDSLESKNSVSASKSSSMHRFSLAQERMKVL